MSPNKTSTITASLPAQVNAAADPGASTGLGWVLWSILAALPWLMPIHAEPWTSFESEWLMAVAMLALGLCVVVAARQRWAIDVFAAGVALVAVVPMLQAWAGLFVHPGEAFLIALYLTAIALTVALARQAQATTPGRLADSLFASFVIAAIVSTGIALYQWLGLDNLGFWITHTGPGSRPAAHLAQPNNLSTLLVWGLIGLWWAHVRKSLGGFVVTLAATFLLLGVALTQSRTGWLAVGLLAAAGVFGQRVLRTDVRVIAGLASGFLAFVLGLAPVSNLLQLFAPMSLTTQVAVGKRPLIWRMEVDAITDRPWFGYGWNQGVQAHVPLAGDYPQLQVTVQHAHNAALDLLLWNGLPLGLLLVSALGLWAWRQARMASRPEQRLPLLTVATFGLHAMLELPHVYVFMLLPVAVMVGTLNAMRPQAASIAIPRGVVAAVLVAHAALLAMIFDDYSRIQADLLGQKMREARIGLGVAAPPSKVLVLQSLQDALAWSRTEPRRGMSAAELDGMRRNLMRYPAIGALFRYARAAALNGRSVDARWALELLCNLNPRVTCEKAARDWETLVEGGNPELKLVNFPLSAGQASLPMPVPGSAGGTSAR